ncbi:MAG: hypothetical protein HOV94_36685 [Saccharothrix sp.]|nr:hypothetical protein [Saccharothrix sp.]
MTRPVIIFETGHAQRIHDALSDLVPGIGAPHEYNDLGVAMGSVYPLTVPTGGVVAGNRYSDVRTAVYVMTDDVRGVRYVGSIHRLRSGLPARLREHFANARAGHSFWTRVGLVRLPDGLGARTVQHCEGWVGRALDPLDNRKLPMVGDTAWRPRPQPRAA